MDEKTNYIALINVRIASKKGIEFDRFGNRILSVLLDEKMATKLKNNGWNIKYIESEEDEDDGFAYVPVTLEHSISSPKIYVQTSSEEIRLDVDKDAIDKIDFSEFSRADFVIHQMFVKTSSGVKVKAYARTIILYQYLKEK